MDLNYNEEFQIPDCHPNSDFNNHPLIVGGGGSVHDNIKIEWDYLQLSHQEITQALENNASATTTATTSTSTTTAENSIINGGANGSGGNGGGGPPIEISPSISNQTVQSLRPSFSSEYETDTTDFLGLIDKSDQYTFKLDANFFFDHNNNIVESNHQQQQHHQNHHHSHNNTSTNGYELETTPKHILSTPAFIDHGTPEFLLLQNEIQELNNAHHQHQQHLQQQQHIQQHHNLNQHNHHQQLPHQSNNRFLLLSLFSSQVFQRLISSTSSTPASGPSPIQIDFEEFVTSPIYEWPNDETSTPQNINLLNTNNIRVRLVNLDPNTISDAVRKTIREEFAVQDLFLSGQAPLLAPEIPRAIRKKNDKDVEWTPLSVYKAYTNIKSPTNGKEAYNHLVPYSSCIGTLNYRPKDHAAWKRSPNRRR